MKGSKNLQICGIKKSSPGWVAGWIEAKAVLRIAYSNQKGVNMHDRGGGGSKIAKAIELTLSQISKNVLFISYFYQIFNPKSWNPNQS